MTTTSTRISGSRLIVRIVKPLPVATPKKRTMSSLIKSKLARCLTTLCKRKATLYRILQRTRTLRQPSMVMRTIISPTQRGISQSEATERPIRHCSTATPPHADKATISTPPAWVAASCRCSRIRRSLTHSDRAAIRTTLTIRTS